MKIAFFSLFLFCFSLILFSQNKGNSIGEESFSQDSMQMILKQFLLKKDSLLQLKLKEPYPDFKAVSLTGDTVTRDMLNGKTTIINFWFEHCAPCIAEFDELTKLYHTFETDSLFLFLSFTNDSKERAKAVTDKYNLPYTVCAVEDRECRRLNFNSAFPTTLIINSSGMVSYYKRGGAVENEQVIKQVAEFEKHIRELLYPENEFSKIQ